MYSSIIDLGYLFLFLRLIAKTIAWSLELRIIDGTGISIILRSYHFYFYNISKFTSNIHHIMNWETITVKI